MLLKILASFQIGLFAESPSHYLFDFLSVLTLYPCNNTYSYAKQHKAALHGAILAGFMTRKDLKTADDIMLKMGSDPQSLGLEGEQVLVPILPYALW